MFSRQLPALRVYLLIQFVFALAFMTYATLSSVYRIEVVGLNPFELVLAGTVLEATVFFLEVPTGVVADAYSRRLSVIIGMVLFGAGFMLEGLVPTLLAVLLAQVLWGAGATFISGALEAWIADEVGNEGIGRTYLRGNQFIHIGHLLGIPLAVTLGSIALGIPLVAAGVILLALALLLLIIMPEDGFTRAPRGERSSWSSMTETLSLGVQTVRGRPVLVTIVIIAALAGASSEAFDRLSDKHLLDNFSFPTLPVDPLDTIAVWFGLIAMAGMAINIGVGEIVRRRIDTDDHEATARALLVATTLLTAMIVGFALAGQFAIAVTFMLTTRIMRNILDPLTLAWLNQSLSSRVRATVISMHGQADALGQIAGGPLLGIIATVVSLEVGFLAGAAILLPALWLYRRSIRNGPLATAGRT